MNPDDFNPFGGQVTRVSPRHNNTSSERKRASCYVRRHIVDPEECQETLLALGLTDPDFVWVRSSPHHHLRVKRTLNGEPYPAEKTGGANADLEKQ